MAQTKVKDGLLNFPDRDDFIQLPSGTTAQRPSSPEQGYSRYNTTDKKLEYWNGTEWQQLPGLTPPIITSLSYPGDDLAADPVGGQTITINGGDFKAGATVTIGGTTPSVITFVSATQITFEAPAKAAGDYDVVVTNTDGGNATSVDGMSYNGVPSWATAAGNLGTFPAGSTIPTITLVATEPDSGTISYSVTTGALPTGLTLTGADIDGNAPTPAGETTYNFSVTASDDENQESTERAFNIVVYIQVTNTVDEVDPFDGNGVALYKLDGDATDESGNYNGTASASLTYTTGLFGQAGLFQNNTNFNVASVDHITMSDITGSTSFSVSLWAKLATIVEPNGGSLVSLVSNTNSTYQLALYAGDNTERFFRAGFGADGTLTAQNTYNFMLDNRWHHIVNVYTGGVNSKVYVDGALVSTVASSSAQTMLINEISKSGGSKGGFNGQIDQVRIFNEALTTLEVSSLYEERVVICGGQAETVDILGDNSCIALYPLDGNANDLSGNYSLTDYAGGAYTTYTVGEFDLALAMRSTADSAYIANLNIPNHNSESFWIKVNTFDDDDDVVFAYYIRRQGYTVPVVWTSAGGVFLDAADNLPLGVWTHIVLSIDGTTLSVYYDGQLQNTKTVSNGVLLNGLGIIADDALTTARFEADQVRIFNKALSSSEVTTLYNETACDVLACSGTTNTLDILGDSSCIAAYPLDGSPLDLSGNNNHGLMVGSGTFRPGKLDLCYSKNNTSAIVCGSFGISGTAANFSGSMWVKFDDFSAGSIFIMLTGSNSIDSTYSLGVNTSGNILIDAYGRAYFFNNTPIFENQWYHIVGVSSGSNHKLYINGVLAGTINQSLNFVDNFRCIGGRSIDNSTIYPDSLMGSIDQVRVFNKALSAGEVTTLYNETACN